MNPQLNKEQEEQMMKDAFKAYYDEKMTSEGVELINKALRSLTEGAFLSGAKYATERITKMFEGIFKAQGGIPFPKL